MSDQMTVKPEVAHVADVRRLDLSPCSFRTPLAGLFLFVPLLDRIDLQAIVAAARLPSSQMIPAAQAVRSLLALKLSGAERKSHVMDLVTDQAIALFAGINVVPKRSYLAAYSSRINHKVCLRFMGWNGSSRPACPMAPLSTWTFIASPPTPSRNH